MIAKNSFLLLLVAVVAASANPAVGKPWHWIERRLSITPNPAALQLPNVVDRMFRPRPKISYPQDVISNCGKAPLASSRVKPTIVGGEEVIPHAYPWLVTLFIDNMYFCAGSIISEDWVMTAAHCMDGSYKVEIVAGAHNITQKEPSQVTMTSTYHFVHPYWSMYTLHNDIAMIRLPMKLKFNDYIQPVCLPKTSENDLAENVMVTPVGWGDTTEGISSSVPLSVDVLTITNSECSLKYGNKITTGTICTSGAGGKGTCYGDSGGPLNYKTEGITEIRGIVSFGPSHGCTIGSPDAFTRVTHYLDWIQENTGVTRDSTSY